MRPQGARLSGAERRAVAEFITGKSIEGDVSGASAGRCTARTSLQDFAKTPHWTGWSPSTTNSRFQSAEQAGLAASDLPRLKLKWAFGFPDASVAWSHPTVAAGRVFVGSQNGTVYSLDAKTGCIYWTFSAKGGVRTAVAVGTGRCVATRRVFRRHGRQRVCARCGHRPHALGATGGRSSICPHHRLADVLRRQALRPSRFVRRGARRRPAVSVLHVSRKHLSARCRIRCRRVEDVHDRGVATATRHQHIGHATLGAGRGRRLVGTDGRCRAPRPVRGDRECV